MATVTVDDSVQKQAFQNFRQRSLLEKTTRVFDRLGYYVLINDESEIFDSKRFVVKSIIEGFQHPSLNHSDFKTELSTHLDIIESLSNKSFKRLIIGLIHLSNILNHIM